MRTPSDTDFTVDVPGIGVFRYGRRTFGDRIAIRRKFLQLTQELSESEDSALVSLASIVAVHAALCVEAPKGWEDLAAIDMLDEPDAEKKVFQIYDALRGTEDSFRQRTSKSS